MQGEPRQIIVCLDSHDLSRRAATQFVELANRSVAERGRFTVCLSGGSTPRETYSLLAGEPFCNQAPWSSIHIFWGDERFIPLHDPNNHYRLATGLFLSKVPIPPENIHRMRVDHGNPSQVAFEYETSLKSFFKLSADEFPVFDLIILGMGADGHMASLFPGTPALQEMKRVVTENYVPKLSADRLTLTLPTLNRARQIMFLVSGAQKADALKQVLEGRDDGDYLPAQLLNPNGGQIKWMIDRDAASRVQSSTLSGSWEN